MADTDILDQITKNAPWLVIPATLLTAAPKLLELWQGLAGARDGKKQLEIEQTRLENLKLRIEIEVLKKQHGIDLGEKAIPAAGAGNSAPAIKSLATGAGPPVEKKIWGWLNGLALRWPRLTSAVAGGLAIAAIWLGLFAVLVYFLVGIEMWATEPKDTGWYFLGGIFAILVPGLLLLKFGYSLRSQNRLLKNRPHSPVAPA